MNRAVDQQEQLSEISDKEASNRQDSKHFIEDEIFQKLLALREEIYQATEINVSPRKLVNLLLKQADFNPLRDQLIKQYS